MVTSQNSVVTLTIVVVVAFTLAQSVIIHVIMWGLAYLVQAPQVTSLLDTSCRVALANMMLVGLMGQAYKHDYMPEIEGEYEDGSESD
jgi:peroxiredoxin family protein